MRLSLLTLQWSVINLDFFRFLGEIFLPLYGRPLYGQEIEKNRTLPDTAGVIGKIFI